MVPEVKHPVGVVSVLQADAIVIPDVVSIQFRPLEDEVLPFWTPIEMVVLRHVANIGSRDKTCVRVEVRSNVLILQLVGKAPPSAEEHPFVVLAEGVTDCWRSNRRPRTPGSVERRNNGAGSVGGRNHAAEPRSPILA